MSEFDTEGREVLNIEDSLAGVERKQLAILEQLQRIYVELRRLNKQADRAMGEKAAVSDLDDEEDF